MACLCLGLVMMLFHVWNTPKAEGIGSVPLMSKCECFVRSTATYSMGEMLGNLSCAHFEEYSSADRVECINEVQG